MNILLHTYFQYFDFFRQQIIINKYKRISFQLNAHIVQWYLNIIQRLNKVLKLDKNN